MKFCVVWSAANWKKQKSFFFFFLTRKCMAGWHTLPTCHTLLCKNHNFWIALFPHVWSRSLWNFTFLLNSVWQNYVWILFFISLKNFRYFKTWHHLEKGLRDLQHPFLWSKECFLMWDPCEWCHVSEDTGHLWQLESWYVELWRKKEIIKTALFSLQKMN